MIAETTPDVLDYLLACVQHLGAAIVPIWGLDDDKQCLCPKGKTCPQPGKHPNGKQAPNGVKNATRDPSILREWMTRAPRNNWGIRCGDPLPGGGFLGVVDADPRNGSDDTLASIEARGDHFPSSVEQISGGAGGHRLYKFATSPASRSLGPGLDFLGAGKYIIVSPSRHVSGGAYHWDLGRAPGDVQIADAPKWMVDATEDAIPRPGRDGEGTARQTVLGELFALSGRAGAVMPDGMMLANCPQSHLHSDARGRGQDASCVILPPAGGSRFGGFRCQHGHCANLKWQEVVALMSSEHYDAAQRKYPRLGVVPPPPPAAAPGASAPARPAPSPLGVATTLSEGQPKEVAVHLKYKPTKNGHKILSDVVNLAAILTYDPRWKGLLVWDEFSQVLRFLRAPPWHQDDAGKEPSEVWSDEDTVRLDLWLRRTWDLELPTQRIREIVYVVGRRDAMNPLTDYLNSLTWDGEARLGSWLAKYAGVEDTAYSRSAGKKWLLSAVARAYDPGCKVDTLLVLEGPQGKGKSTLLRSLVPEPSWFSDTPIDLASKDAYVALRGKWILEFAELASLRKADLDRTKAFFTSPIDSYRPPYGREQISVPRTCIFAGTVNSGEYLGDVSGARRFWPAKCGVVDLESLIADRDQLWAEAVSTYKLWVGRGRPQSECLWWPSYDELGAFEAEQDERQVAGATNPWIEAIALWTQTEDCKRILEKRDHLFLRDIAFGALGLSDKDLDSSKSTAIGIIMVRDLKWSKRRFRLGGARPWGYLPPEA